MVRVRTYRRPDGEPFSAGMVRYLYCQTFFAMMFSFGWVKCVMYGRVLTIQAEQ